MNLHVLTHLLTVIFLAIIAFILLGASIFYILCRAVHMVRVCSMIKSLEERSEYIRQGIAEVRQEVQIQIKDEIFGKDNTLL